MIIAHVIVVDGVRADDLQKSTYEIFCVRDCQCIYGWYLFIESIYRFVERKNFHFMKEKKKRIE